MQLRRKLDNLKKLYEKKLACNIKNDSESLFAYMRNKQNMRDKVGPLEVLDH